MEREVARNAKFRWVVRHLGNKKGWKLYKAGPWGVKTDCELVRYPRKKEKGAPPFRGKKEKVLKLQVKPQGSRADLRLTSTCKIPNVPAGTKWHRLVAYAFKPRFKKLSSHKSLEADHGGRWWYVAKGKVRWMSGAENRKQQGKDGLAGRLWGSKRAQKPPPWAAP